MKAYPRDSLTLTATQAPTKPPSKLKTPAVTESEESPQRAKRRNEASDS
jgi:hypothetical protein